MGPGPTAPTCAGPPARPRFPLLTTAAAALAAANGVAEWTQPRPRGAEPAGVPRVRPRRGRLRQLAGMQWPPVTSTWVDRRPDHRRRLGRVADPVMTASGTAGHGAELAAFVDLSALGAVVVKSLSADPWAGNPPRGSARRPAGMINSVGLQGPGVDGVARRRAARPACAPARPGRGVASGAARSTSTRGRPTLLADVPARRWSRSRSTCRARTSTAAATSSPTTPMRPAEVDRGDRRVRPAPVGEAAAPTPTGSSRSPAPRPPLAPRRSRSSTRCSGW